MSKLRTLSTLPATVFVSSKAGFRCIGLITFLFSNATRLRGSGRLGLGSCSSFFANVGCVQRVGQDGPLLLQDFHLVDLLSHFDRERIPERVVHAKGAGAHGVFKCTKTLEDICFADVFTQEGLECPVTVRFSVS